MKTVNPVENKANEKWSKACLRISGDTFRPDQATAVLGLEPTKSGVKGELYSSRHNIARRTSFWYIECPLSDRLPLEEHLGWLLDLFEPKRDLISSISEKWRIEFFCGFASENGQGGATFNTNLLRRLAHLGVPVVLNLYPPGAPSKIDEESSVSGGTV